MPAPSAPAPVVLESLPRSCPVDQIVTAYSVNPRLRARLPRAQDVYLEEVLEENVTVRMLTKDGEPLAFVVPDGCNAVDFYLGPIELNPDHGEECDLDEVVTAGDLTIGGLDRCLSPGDQLTVVVTWRHGSWVELAAGHLRLPVHARFYARTSGVSA